MNRKHLLVYLLGLGIAQPIAVFAASQVAAPSKTKAVPVSESRVDVSWKDNSSNENGFELYRSASGVSGLFTLVARADAGVTALGDVGLNPSTQYCYKVRAVAGREGRTRYSDFSKPACATTAAPPAQPGTIHITTAITGFDLDMNGYFVRLDVGSDQPIGTKASVTVAGVAAGEHTVWLGDVASNCTVKDVNPRAVIVTDGATTEVVFEVDCGAGPTIELTTLTTAKSIDDIDRDGYGVMLWQRGGGGRILAQNAGVPANGSVRFFGLVTGQYDLEVNGIAANCMQANALPSVDLSSGGKVSLALNVSCDGGVTCSVEICDNGIDDDCDGQVDWLDTECHFGCLDCGFDHCPPGFVCGYDGCCVAHCGDGQWNGTEGDVDCGGDCGAKCQAGQHCGLNYDCASGICSYSVCQ